MQEAEYVDSIPGKINNYKIELITTTNKRKLYQSHHNKLTHTKMFPLKVEDSLLSITFVPYFGQLEKRRHYHLALSGGSTVYFKFDCEKNNFIIYKVKLWGI
ncbi:hypothetical protein ACFQ3S_04595 [Mucilaginibacter terrae]